VGDLKDAIMAKFKQRFTGVDPDQMQLFKVDGAASGSRTALDPTLTLSDASILAGAKLEVVVTTATAVTGVREFLL
jgi:hypothetical protein